MPGAADSEYTNYTSLVGLTNKKSSYYYTPNIT